MIKKFDNLSRFNKTREEMADTIFLKRHQPLKDDDYINRVYLACQEVLKEESSRCNINKDSIVANRTKKVLKAMSIKYDIPFKRLKMIFSGDIKER